MTDIVRGASHQTDIGHLPDFDCIVCNQAVTALYQLNCRFTFTDTAFAGDEYAFTINLNQYAVTRDTGCQIQIQKGNQTRNEVGGTLLAAQERYIIFFGQIQHFGEIRQFPGNNQRRNVTGHQHIQPLGSGFLVNCRKIGKFHLSDDLHAFRVKVFIKSHQL